MYVRIVIYVERDGETERETEEAFPVALVSNSIELRQELKLGREVGPKGLRPPCDLGQATIDEEPPSLLVVVWPHSFLIPWHKAL